jgi:hypothetical protein
LVSKMFMNTRAVLLCASACMKPSASEFATMVKPIHADFDAITKIKETKDRSLRDWALHFQTVAEGAACVGWIHAVRTVVTREIINFRPDTCLLSGWGSRRSSQRSKGVGGVLF